MTRMSKQGERRNRCPKKRKYPAAKTGPKKDNLANGYREHVNAAQEHNVFIGKVK
ncbi:MAG: hypothetical protein MRY21_03715 [Simkaniaceae bacterium]|nr:hypothetical protein [Simkaniaceae bacterium]